MQRQDSSYTQNSLEKATLTTTSILVYILGTNYLFSMYYTSY